MALGLALLLPLAANVVHLVVGAVVILHGEGTLGTPFCT